MHNCEQQGQIPYATICKANNSYHGKDRIYMLISSEIRVSFKNRYFSHDQRMYSLDCLSATKSRIRCFPRPLQLKGSPDSKEPIQLKGSPDTKEPILSIPTSNNNNNNNNNNENNVNFTHQHNSKNTTKTKTFNNSKTQKPVYTPDQLKPTKVR
ncbi:diacylglycerol kinase A-like [Schistocerca americana]|uniref:diacylglycerol kinase A-like n=1 Tax=Schistocerca americana TaxID=7009 RepID=UPI001F4FCBEF|nr:diacylglycerol kinase A-like [Schistocerca americana]